MPEFAYEALDDRGEEHRGTIAAATIEEASRRLRGQGLFITSLRQASFSETATWNCPHCAHPLQGNVERCEACGAWVVGQDPGAAPTSSELDSSGALSETDEQLLMLLRDGQKIQAIKLYRDATHASLADAKRYVEALAARHGLPSGGSAGCAATAALLIFAPLVALVWFIARFCAA